jgi:hypothetical protein
MSVHVVAPVRCPYCRKHLVSRSWLRSLGPHVRWCTKCRCTVAYCEADSDWQFLGYLEEDA